MEARQAEVIKKMTALMQAGQATMKANEAKLADVQKRMEAPRVPSPWSGSAATRRARRPF